MAKKRILVSETAALKNTATKPVNGGDVVGGETPVEARALTVNRKIRKKINHEAIALKDKIEHAKDDKRAVAENYLSNFPTEERRLMLQILLEESGKNGKGYKIHPDEELSKDWRNGGYPYKNLMSRKNYEAQKYDLQVELLKLQAWTKKTGSRVIILFEGRDAAGKGGHHQADDGAFEPTWRPGGGPRKTNR